MANILPGLLLLMPIPAMAAAPPPDVPRYAEFKNWLVACDNTRHCEARGFNDSAKADLRVVRDAGDAPPVLTLTTQDPVDESALRLDGAAFPLTGPGWGAKDGALSVQGAPAAAAVARLKDAHRLTAPDGTELVPLDGMAAALLLMDAVQGRPGTPSALVAARGAGTAPPAPAAPAIPAWRRPSPGTGLPALIATTRRGAAKALQAGDCTSTDAAEAHTLDAGHTLVLIPCALYAYQDSAMAYVVGAGGQAQPFTPRLPVLGDLAEPLVSAGFDPATGTLATASKGRGIADCGFSARWVWGEGAFHLAALSYQVKCGGAAPGDWPTLFRTAGGDAG